MFAKDLSFAQVVQNNVTVFLFELFREKADRNSLFHAPKDSAFPTEQDVKVIVNSVFSYYLEAFGVLLLREN